MLLFDQLSGLLFSATGNHVFLNDFFNLTVYRFHEQGKGYQYLSLRNFNGMGHSYESISGHGAFLSDVKDVPGANGEFGYRRNTPWLRQCPSVFGTTNPSSSAY